MTEFGSLRRWLVLASMLALAGCNSSSPLTWSAADEIVDDDGDDQVTEERPSAPDSGVIMRDAGMDSGITVVEVKPPCGTGPGCDPLNMGGETCESLGAGHGRLLCDPATCLFEVGLCDGLPQDASVGRPCGTGPGCNVKDLGGETCQSLGMAAGVLGCDEETCQFDTSLCGGGPGQGGAGGLFGGGASGGGTGTGAGGGNFFGGNFFGGGDTDGGVGTGNFFGGNFFGGNPGGDAGVP